MKYLKQTLLILVMMGTTTHAVFAHAGTHHMAFFERVVHFITSSFHLGPVIGMILVLLVLKMFRKWID